MSDSTTTLPEGIEPSIFRLTVGRLNHWAMEANDVILCLTQRHNFGLLEHPYNEGFIQYITV